ncbi:MAG: cobalt ECF transporter T component CbiQ [Geobacteraceae bacterium]|nr:cobalt ECF transporter T component CbiQ [Geobacteraceae bacterium]NTW81651.1 cobalt ECF transporter T component CbiQ [Geobacteraceae bacterium]
MLTEQSAYTNRWRQISPVAKGLVSLFGMVAAFAAGSPRAALLVAIILSLATVLGAGIPPARYLRVATPALFFLLASCLSLLVSLEFNHISTFGVSLHLSESELPRITQVCCRSLACLTALLFLALTTPLTDIISLMRRCKLPETLLDLMTLSYRTLFVLSEAVHETATAQSARLGYATFKLSMRSLGGLVANLAVQVWQRSQALHLSASARGNDGALRFLEPDYPGSHRAILSAVICGILLVVTAVYIP